MTNKVFSGSLQYQQDCAPTVILERSLTPTVVLEQVEEASEQGTLQTPSHERSESPSTPPRVVQRLREYGVHSPLSKTLVAWQKQFSPDRRGGTALQLDASAMNREVFGTPGNIYIKKKAIARGAESQVFDVLQFPRDGSSPNPKIAKFAKRSFEEQREAQLLISPSGKKYINTFESVSCVQGRRIFIGIVPPAECDLEHLSLDHYRRPIFTVVRISKEIAAGMASLHRTDQIHRDLKPANILILGKGEDAQAQVTDFGLVSKERREEHMTALTPQYAPDFIWKSIVNQRDRRGVQTKEADVFSLGRTFLHGGVFKLLDHYQKKTGISFQDLLPRLEPTILDMPKTDEELLDISRAAVGPVIIAFSGFIPSKVLLYPSQESIAETLDQCVLRLESHLEPTDLKMLQQYVALVVNLQRNDPDLLPTMEQVEESLQHVCFPSIPTLQFNEVAERGSEGQEIAEEANQGEKRSHSPEPKYRSVSVSAENELKKRKSIKRQRDVE
ncbi:MAG: protein kinase [Chlamydiia bacterium]|nr:protein kinase [Chlamydiia bacterium]